MSDDATAVVVTTSLRAKPGQEQALMDVLRGLAEAVRRDEAGCLQYVPVRSRHEPECFVVFERYRDDEALGEHANSAHLVQTFPALMACLSEPPVLRIFDGFDAG